MRIQMRLSKEGRVVLEELKLEYLKNDESKTSGVIVDEIFEYFSSNFKNVNWKFVQNAPEFDEILADYTTVNPTTLNLSKETINTMYNIRDYFNGILGMKRTVYRSFIIRMVLKAYKLEKEGTNIYL
ncbi:hypothetical protein ACVRY0_08555 [Streptococcus intermedius]|uniref:hypothetical protein n=1 Tax=Streptococcus TaxID=1301 RepID=UPI000FBA4DA7|nr:MULTISPECIES: hypothetical protein [Streptococcus]MCY7023626.1 hypothetical protein [Streptococcus sanguinis]RSJ10221.1 hypothetical protein D8833_04900 [Streptococcus intermedius]RSJ15809.1 hypothetical protein D8831_06270 [Streptococcus intermedius]RSJ29929.1 hypothetical protein D8824_07435 [Streptococcus intermedius]